jgi:hypothetical protein
MLWREAGSGMIVAPEGFNFANRKLIIELNARHRLRCVPATFEITTADGKWAQGCVVFNFLPYGTIYALTGPALY